MNRVSTLLCLLSVAVPGLSLMPVGPVISFSPAQDYAVGFAPVDIVTGDFNEDGKLDLLTLSSPDLSPFPQLSLLLGNGDGTFQSVRYLDTPKTAGAQMLAVGDFNGDGSLDVAICGLYFMARRNASVVWVLLGNGDGTLQNAVSYPFTGALTGLAAGHLNGDRNLDLVAVDTWGGNVYVLTGNGDGTFQSLPDFNSGRRTRFVAIGDFNRDHKADLVITNPYGGEIFLLRGNGDGTFQAAAPYPVPGAPYFPLVADLNRDGRPDIAIADWNGMVSVLLGKGDGTVHAAMNYLNVPTPSNLAAGDFNGDGIPDLVAPNHMSGNTITVLAGNGDGTFGAPLTFYINHEPGSITPIAVAIGDFDGNGKPDVAVADYDFAVGSSNNSYVSVFLNNTVP